MSQHKPEAYQKEGSMSAHFGRFVAYYRVSTDKQGESGLGLDVQREAVMNYLNGGGPWTLIAEHTEVESKMTVASIVKKETEDRPINRRRNRSPLRTGTSGRGDPLTSTGAG